MHHPVEGNPPTNPIFVENLSCGECLLQNTGSSVSVSDRNRILAQMNSQRAKYQAAPLKWSNSVATSAQVSLCGALKLSCGLVTHPSDAQFPMSHFSLPGSCRFLAQAPFIADNVF